MKEIKAYLLSQRLLDENGEQRTWIFNCPMYKSLKAARIHNQYYNKTAGYIKTDGQPCWIMGGIPICSYES